RTLSPPEPISRRELVILGLFAIIALTQGWSGAAITHALPFAQDAFGWSDARVFDVLATVRAVSLLALALSWYGDHRGRRRPLLIAFILLPLGNLATALFVDPVAFIGLQSLARIGTIALGSLAIVVLAEEIKPEIRSYSIGIYAMFGSMGTGLGLLLRPIAATGADNWRLIFALSALPLLAAPFLAMRIGESRAYVQRTVRPSIGAVLRAPHGRRFWPMAGLAFSISAFTAPAANLALVRLESDLGWSAATASLLLALSSAPGVAIGVLAGGRLSDIAGRKPTEAVSIFVGVAGGVAFYFLEAGWLMGLGIFVSTLGAFAFGPAFGSHRSELFPTAIRSTAAAWIVNASIFGGLVGFAAGRFVVEAWGVPTTIATLGGLLLVASLLIRLLPETKGLHLTPNAEETELPPGAMPG
ncbi:MAG: MFS transporter, partial [Acidimicrobiia bacterium]